MTSTTDELPEVRPVGFRRGLVRFGVAFAAGVAIVAMLAAAASYAYALSYEGRVLPGVRVGPVDLSGLTRDDAAKRLASAYASMGAGHLVVVGPDASLALAYSDVGREPSADAMAGDAMVVGRAPDPLERAASQIRTLLRGVVLQPRVTFDSQLLTRRVLAFADTQNRAPTDAGVVSSPGGFVPTASLDGRRVDTGAVLPALLDALARPDAPQTITAHLPGVAVPPAIDDVSAALAASRAERSVADVLLASGKEQWTIPAPAVRSWIRFGLGPDGTFAAGADPDAVETSIRPLATAMDRAPKDATFLLAKDDAPVGVRPAVDGRLLDAAGTAQVVVAALAARQASEAPFPPVAPVFAVTKPVLTTEQANAVAPSMSLVSSWTTWYPINDHNGFGANIEIPTRLIDGSVVAPGATFDFWSAIGEVTAARGYKLGGAIIDGQTQAQGALGGGICSTSTTLFNAALRDGLAMGARANHYYYIDRYPLGLDATVFISEYGWKQTMSFTNDTPYPILIRGRITHQGWRGFVHFDLWSVPTGRKVSFTTPIVKNRVAATTITKLDPTLPAGTRDQREYATEGKDVWVTRTVVDAKGTTIHRETYYSHYAKVDGLILVGTGGVPPAP